MMLTKRRTGLRILLVVFLVWPLSVLAAFNGNYQGTYQNKKVTAVFETMTSTVTGVLVIGDERYVLQAANGGETVSGLLTNMKNGSTLELLLKPAGNALEVDIKGNAQSSMHFILNRAP